MFNWEVSRRRNRIYEGSIFSPQQMLSLGNWVIKVINKVKEKTKVSTECNDDSGDIKHQLVLLYKGDNGILILRSKEKYVRELLPKKSTLQVMYTGKKLSSQINIKDKTNFEHQHNLIPCELSYTNIWKQFTLVKLHLHKWTH